MRVGMDGNNILATGLSGLVGSRLQQVLTDYSFTDLSLTSGVDITNENEVENAFVKNDAPWVLHLAALADVDKCESEHELAYKVNVMGTKNIAQVCKKYGKKMILISTDFVFAGDDIEYFEDSERKAKNYYGETKILAENEVTKILPANQWVILRISHPYKILTVGEPKKSFFQRMYEILESGKELTAIRDFFSKPTYIDDIALMIDKLIKLNLRGSYHGVGGSLETGVEEAELICEVFGFNRDLIKPVELEKYFAGKAKRPRKLDLNNDKIKKAAGIQIDTFEEGLREIKPLIKSKMIAKLVN